MAHNNIEIEIQVKIEKSQGLLNFLQENATFQGEKHQLDEYYSPINNDFLAVRPTKEWLRLRESNGQASINYKNWLFDEHGVSNHCDEFESKIEIIEPVRMILKALKFKSIAIVDKQRRIWTFQDYEISFDSVKNLGDFVEIEYIGQDDNVDPKKVTDEMVIFLKKFDCGKITRNYVGYPFIILFPQEVKYEPL